MKKLGLTLAMAIAAAGSAYAADLPTTKAPAPPPPNCFASFWTWLNSSASDCSLTYAGITLYGTLDLNYGYQDWGTPKSMVQDKLNYGIQKDAYEHIWQAGYAGLSADVLGLRMKEDLAPLGLAGWSAVGVLEAGINPYSGMFMNGPRALADANTTANTGVTAVTVGKTVLHQYYSFQKTNIDSSRAGQWDNSQGYVGVSNNTWGTLTFGRTNSLAFDAMPAYDPMAGSNAFSLIGFSTSFPAFGTTEIARINTALTYKVAIPNVAGIFNTVRLAGQAQIGGYGVGNGAMAHYEGQAGFDWGNFSFDGILSWAKDAASLATYNGTYTLCNTSGYYGFSINGTCYNPNDVLKATLSNNFGAELMASYKWDRFKFYGGYIYARLSDPSDSFSGGFRAMYPAIVVPPTQVTSTGYLLPNDTLSAPQYAYDKNLNTIWTGVKYSVPDEWLRGYGAMDLITAFYYQTQNNFNFAWTTGNIKGVPYGYATPAACTGTGAFISSSKCAGSQDGLSVMADWRPFKRVDIYAGVMLTNVYGGLANGFYNTLPIIVNGKVLTTYNEAHTQNYDPTIGIRIRF